MGDFETLVAGRGLVEGPRPDGAGNVLFADVTQGGVHRWSPSGVETVLAGRRGVGGLVVHAAGGVVVTGRDVSAGDRVVLPAPPGVTGFNDLVSTDDGGLLVGALRFRPMAGEPPVPGEVWRIDPGGAARAWAGEILWANGIGLSPAADAVYVSDFATGEVLRFAPDGTGRQVFAHVPDGSPDGLAVDVAGGVWVALGPAGAIARYGADGRVEERIDVPAEFVASLAFDGEDLLVATLGSLLRTRAGIAGRPVSPASV